MKNKIISIVVLIVLFVSLSTVVIAAENKVYELKLSYDNGFITTKDIAVKPGLPQKGLAQTEIGYKAELISFTDEILNSFKFEIPLTIFVDRIDLKTGEMISETIQLDKTDFILKVPYFKNGKTINIYNPNSTKVLSVDISHFAVTCSNNICEPHEDYKSCPQDCKGLFNWIYLIIIGIILIISIIAIILYKRRKTKEV